MNHLIIRKEGVFCTRCLITEPVNQGDGTPMDSMIAGYMMCANRHTDCENIPTKKAAIRADKKAKGD